MQNDSFLKALRDLRSTESYKRNPVLQSLVALVVLILLVLLYAAKLLFSAALYAGTLAVGLQLAGYVPDFYMYWAIALTFSVLVKFVKNLFE